MIVILINGQRLNISKQMAEIIKEKILRPEGAKQWQLFSNEQNEILALYNLMEIAAIVPETDIVTPSL